MKRATLVAIGLAALAFALMAAHFLYVAVFGAHIRSSLRSDLASDLANVISFGITAVVGALIVARRPDNRVGWLIMAIDLLGTYLTFSMSDITSLGVDVAPGVVPFATVPLWLAPPLYIVFAAMYLVILPLAFPDGHLLSSRWRWAVVGIPAGVLAVVPGMFSATALDSYGLRSPFHVAALNGYQSAAAPNSFIAGSIVVPALAGWASLALRYRRGTAELKRQVRWLIVAGAANVAVVVASLLIPNFYGWLQPLVAVALPVSIGIAVLKYRLYDVDIVINRAIVYGALAVFITAVYVGIVVGIGGLIGSGRKPNLLLSIAATAIVAVGFQPARERLQRFANRLVYGKRATPYEVLAQFSGNVAETYAADEVLPRMARVLAEGTAAESASVWLHDRRVATFGTNGGHPDTIKVDVRHQGEVLGALSIRKRQGETLTPIEQKLVDDLAHQAGLVLKNVGLTADLQARLVDLRESRKRLVAAQDEERRKLERNLHDGAQQNLVALKVKLGLAEMLIDKDVSRALTTLAELKTETDDTLETLRDLARGIYPPLLAEKGLRPALEAQARKATLRVAVQAEGLGRYAQDIEAAVYFCVLEALQNVQKYSGATSAVVRLSEQAGRLHFEVEDDGRGFDPKATARGAGLTNMEDRLDAIGGSIRIASAVGRGTTLTGEVAVAPATSDVAAGQMEPLLAR